MDCCIILYVTKIVSAINSLEYKLPNRCDIFCNNTSIEKFDMVMTFLNSNSCEEYFNKVYKPVIDLFEGVYTYYKNKYDAAWNYTSVKMEDPVNYKNNAALVINLNVNKADFIFKMGYKDIYMFPFTDKLPDRDDSDIYFDAQNVTINDIINIIDKYIVPYNPVKLFNNSVPLTSYHIVIMYNMLYDKLLLKTPCFVLRTDTDRYDIQYNIHTNMFSCGFFQSKDFENIINENTNKNKLFDLLIDVFNNTAYDSFSKLLCKIRDNNYEHNRKLICDELKIAPISESDYQQEYSTYVINRTYDNYKSFYDNIGVNKKNKKISNKNLLDILTDHSLVINDIKYDIVVNSSLYTPYHVKNIKVSPSMIKSGYKSEHDIDFAGSVIISNYSHNNEAQDLHMFELGTEEHDGIPIPYYIYCIEPINKPLSIIKRKSCSFIELINDIIEVCNLE
jgi:hypothetical protein